MTYAAQLIEAVKAAKGFQTDKELADAIGVKPPSLNVWKKGKASPMPEERVMQLCELAKIADPAPWLIGIHADAVKDRKVHRALESLLDRLPPSFARAAMLGAVLLGYFALPLPAQSTTLAMQPEQSQAICIMRSF